MLSRNNRHRQRNQIPKVFLAKETDVAKRARSLDADVVQKLISKKIEGLSITKNPTIEFDVILVDYGLSLLSMFISMSVRIYKYPETGEQYF